MKSFEAAFFDSLLGLPHDEAQSRLLSRGFAVKSELLEPRKPPLGDTLRVIGVRLLEDGVVKLIYANFRTKVV
ncbi:MAG: hypothetical protein FWF10_02960 [Clostridiales bacterium]|nr:hypothetical protein [Clostridiales bacterium]